MLRGHAFGEDSIVFQKQTQGSITAKTDVETRAITRCVGGKVVMYVRACVRAFGCDLGEDDREDQMLTFVLPWHAELHLWA